MSGQSGFDDIEALEQEPSFAAASEQTAQIALQRQQVGLDEISSLDLQELAGLLAFLILRLEEACELAVHAESDKVVIVESCASNYVFTVGSVPPWMAFVERSSSNRCHRVELALRAVLLAENV